MTTPDDPRGSRPFIALAVSLVLSAAAPVLAGCKTTGDSAAASSATEEARGPEGGGGGGGGY